MTVPRRESCPRTSKNGARIFSSRQAFVRAMAKRQSKWGVMSSVADTYRHLLETASFAARAHHGQMRKDKETPYVSHVFRVCLIVRDVFGFQDPRMLIAALLHD